MTIYISERIESRDSYEQGEVRNIGRYTYICVCLYIEMPTAIFNFHFDLAQNEIPIFVFKS